MNTADFFRKLQDLYNPDFDEKGNWLVKYAVKFWCQAESFNFAIYDEENAFHGKEVFLSEVYYFWHNEDAMKKILEDIDEKLSELERGS